MKLFFFVSVEISRGGSSFREFRAYFSGGQISKK